MKVSVCTPLIALSLLLSTAAPVFAGAIPQALLASRVDASAGIMSAAFGDGPPTGPRHAKRSHAGSSQQSIEPSHADLNGATRESADKAYRKKYGF